MFNVGWLAELTLWLGNLHDYGLMVRYVYVSVS